MRNFFLISLLLLFVGLSSAFAQQDTMSFTPIKLNIDSIIRDSIRKAFILNHKPLSKQEKAMMNFKKEASAYGNYANFFLKNTGLYSLDIPKRAMYSSKRLHQNIEWIFYSFLFLFLFTALLGRYSNGLLRKLWKIYVNDGFIFRQSKDQMAQQQIVSVALNFLFILSTGLFIFFGLGWDQEFSGNMRWLILAACFVVIAVVYLFKHLFFKILGWAFGQEQAFEDYLFVVFLNNKLLGLLFLFSSFVMAFSDAASSSLTFKLSLFIVALMLVYRFLRGFQLFSNQVRVGFFTLFLAFLALELIPSAVLIKFLTKSADHYLTALL